VKYTNIFPHTNIELTNSAVAIFAKSAKISPAEFALMWSLGVHDFLIELKSKYEVLLMHLFSEYGKNMELGQIINKLLKENGIFQKYSDVNWRDKDKALNKQSCIEYQDVKFTELHKNDAVKLLSSALCNDLCYGVKRMGKTKAEQIAVEFISSHHDGARFYTNSSIPYHQKSSSWLFTSITNATIDTGVIVREGHKLVSLLWIADTD
jgi:hypothetical protein